MLRSEVARIVSRLPPGERGEFVHSGVRYIASRVLHKPAHQLGRFASRVELFVYDVAGDDGSAFKVEFVGLAGDAANVADSSSDPR